MKIELKKISSEIIEENAHGSEGEYSSVFYKGRQVTFIKNIEAITAFLSGKSFRCPKCKHRHKSYVKLWDRSYGEFLVCSYCFYGADTSHSDVRLNRCAVRAKKKGIEMEIDQECIEELLDSQNNCCALSGLSFDKHKWSIDRIDSSGGYTKDNIQLVIPEVNWMKKDMNQDYFIKLCGLIFDYSGE